MTTDSTTENMTAPILVLEDEPSLRKGLRLNLEAEGYRVQDFENAEDALTGLRSGTGYGLGILDIRLPGDMDGLEFCRQLRKERHTFPVILLTARGELPDRLAGFEAGADDYLTKPFDLEELLARVRACLRRSGATQGLVDWRVGDWTVDPESSSATSASGETIRFNEREMNILALLVRQRGRPVPRDEILDVVWGLEKYPTNRTVDNYIVKFRKIFEKDPRHPELLLTRHGVGYELVK